MKKLEKPLSSSSSSSDSEEIIEQLRQELEEVKSQLLQKSNEVEQMKNSSSFASSAILDDLTNKFVGQIKEQRSSYEKKIKEMKIKMNEIEQASKARIEEKRESTSSQNNILHQ